MKYEASRGHYAVAGLQDDQGRYQHLLIVDPYGAKMFVVDINGLRLPVLPRKDTSPWHNMQVLETCSFDDRQAFRKMPTRIQQAVMYALCQSLSQWQAYMTEYDKLSADNREYSKRVKSLEMRVYELENKLKEASVKLPSTSEPTKKPSASKLKPPPPAWTRSVDEILAAATAARPRAARPQPEE